MGWAAPRPRGPDGAVLGHAPQILSQGQQGFAVIVRRQLHMGWAGSGKSRKGTKAFELFTLTNAVRMVGEGC